MTTYSGLTPQQAMEKALCAPQLSTVVRLKYAKMAGESAGMEVFDQPPKTLAYADTLVSEAYGACSDAITPLSWQHVQPEILSLMRSAFVSGYIGITAGMLLLALGEQAQALDEAKR
jgi:hypothetical protein